MSPGPEALRIGLIAPVAGPVTPHSPESIPALLAGLAERLVQRGHIVTLYATGDSQTAAHLHAALPCGYDTDPELWDWYRAEAINAAAAVARAGEHDVLHAHDFGFAVPYAPLTSVPMIETLHTETAPETLAAAHRGGVRLVALSDHQRRSLGELDAAVIPHGIDVDAMPFGTGDGGYLLYLGRMLADKGPADAVRIARATGRRLILAGPAEDGYSLTDAAEVDGEQIRWVGPVDTAQRDRLLAGATALLFPLAYPEPFGLVLIEAMACGTPVLATDIGASPEIVTDGVTGFVAGDWRELAARVEAAAGLDRAQVRAAARARHDLGLMTDRYEALYRRVTTALAARA